ncbi:helix-turn-helix domain-containing protein [Streptomyces sp. NPDC005227]|uniref:helix-turn-helix domain-containing protein n=1 Tax=Streptomyces sp. NPDC005227 TaxID=3364707 RepID=UPI0036CBDBD1
MPAPVPLTPDSERYGSWLIRRLERLGMSQTDLAVKVGRTPAAVSAWVNARSEPRSDLKDAIAALLDPDHTDPPPSTDIYGVQTSPPTPVAAAHRQNPTSSVRWHHRPAHPDGGREYGNAAAFAFDADLSVLAREATQNSLDERRDTQAPVRVRYTLHELDGEYLDAFLAALRWNEVLPHYTEACRGDQKVSRSLRSAIDDLSQEHRLTLLRVDDYNASGLTGPEYGDGRFAAVVRRQLDSHKVTGGRAGGSYGLGKATLWATSRFGLVLINSTLSEPHEGRRAGRVIGRLDLPWHEVDGNPYAGPAWFGLPDTAPEHAGVSRSWWADDDTLSALRLDRVGEEPGTSFLVVGAHDASGDAESLEEMHDKLLRSLADGFWAAMVGGRTAGPMLEASVTTLRNGRVHIREQQVDPHAYHPATSRALKAYLDGTTVDELTAADQVVRADVPLIVTPLKGQGRSRDKGREHLAVLLLTPADENDSNVNRVICMRGNRMTITAHRPRELPLGTTAFQAVLLAGYATGRGDAEVRLAEAFLRASEPPEHDRWDRTEELTTSYERGALSRLKEFRGDIDRSVRSLLGRRRTPPSAGPAVLRELLKLDAPGRGPGSRRAQSFPTVRDIQAFVDKRGAWHVTVRLHLPEADDPWVLAPVAKFDVRSGGRPSVKWELLVGSESCRAEDGTIVVEPGVRIAEFSGVTDPDSHPVRGTYARLAIDVPKARGGAQ